jgi:hypothetical protein
VPVGSVIVRGEPDSGVTVITVIGGESLEGEPDGRDLVTVTIAGCPAGRVEVLGLPDKVMTVDDPEAIGIVTTVGLGPDSVGDPTGVSAAGAA